MVNHLMSDDHESLNDINEPILSKAAVDAHEWFDEECDMLVDIFDIINRCLKVAKRYIHHKLSRHSHSMTAVMQYVKLHDCYCKNPSCTKPCLNASLAIAWGVGKDQYHARQIRTNEKYLLKHSQLSPSKKELHLVMCRAQLWAEAF
jgi:hypothetical protein